MRRRDFISLLGAAAVLCSARSRAQQPSKTYLIGVLTSQIPSLIKALKDGLRKLGYIEGQNLKVEYRFLTTGGASAETLATELVNLGPDIIITIGTSMTIAAKRATTTIPIVMAPVQDALAAGIVTNLAHPGGNVTGTMLYGSELAGKRVDVFKAAVPAIARIAVLGTRSQLTQCSGPRRRLRPGRWGWRRACSRCRAPKNFPPLSMPSRRTTPMVCSSWPTLCSTARGR
jgi:putative ABC transport system substrate-binding protein